MGLLDDCLQYFDTKDLYQVLSLKKDASHAEIKKSYRKLSLKYHPDRHEDTDEKAKATKIFQTLSKVHFILSDEEKRKFYDTTGLVDKEDALEEGADWEEYFRALFPKVTVKDIDDFFSKYLGSEDEKEDIKKWYNKFEGDMDKISQCLIGFDEDRTRQLIENLIEEGELEAFDAFTSESASKREKRKKKAEKEAKAAKKARQELKTKQEDLAMAIQSRSKSNFDSMIASLEAKYANGGKGNKSSSNKKGKK